MWSKSHIGLDKKMIMTYKERQLSPLKWDFLKKKQNYDGSKLTPFDSWFYIYKLFIIYYSFKE